MRRGPLVTLAIVLACGCEEGPRPPAAAAPAPATAAPPAQATPDTDILAAAADIPEAVGSDGGRYPVAVIERVGDFAQVGVREELERRDDLEPSYLATQVYMKRSRGVWRRVDVHGEAGCDALDTERFPLRIATHCRWDDEDSWPEGPATAGDADPELTAAARACQHANLAKGYQLELFARRGDFAQLALVPAEGSGDDPEILFMRRVDGTWPCTRGRLHGDDCDELEAQGYPAAVVRGSCHCPLYE
jgi:hypothetical protein